MTKVLYIAGAGHSGSSLFDVLLGSTDDTSSTGEVHRLSIAPDRRWCPCGSVIGNCHYWSAVRETLADQLGQDIASWDSIQLTGGPQSYGKGRRIAQIVLALLPSSLVEIASHRNRSLAAQQQAAMNSWHLFRAIAANDSSSVVVDSTKSPGRLKSLQHADRDSNLYVIHLVRDGRAVIASEMRRTDHGALHASINWLVANLNAMAMLWTFPRKRTMRIRYEDLCHTPLTYLNIARHHMELPGITRVQLPKRTEIHTVPGNPMLLDDLTEIRLDERWRRQLSRSDRALFALAAGPLNRLFGYR